MKYDFSKINPCGGCCDNCGFKKSGECKGCRESAGKCVKLWSNGCRIYECCENHNAYFCGVCSNFPVNGLSIKSASGISKESKG